MTAPQQETSREWRSRAACRDVDAELFFPVAEAGPAYAAQVAQAKAVCAGCPVRAECLDEALAHIPYGIAGGLTEHERRALRRTRRVPTTPDELSDVTLAGRLSGLTARQRAGVGRALLAAGRSPRQVAGLCEVTTRTAERWAGQARTTTDLPAGTSGGTGERSRGGNRAPLRISTARNALADESTERT